MNRAASLPRQMLYYGLGLVLMKGISLLMLPIITRYLLPSEYGVLDVVLTWINVLGIIFGFGMAEVLYRFSLNPDTAKQVYRYLLKLHIYLIVPLLFTFCTAVWLCSSWLPEALTQQIVITAIFASGFASVTTLPLCWLRMQEKANCFFYCTAGKAAFQAALCWLFLEQGLGVAGVLYASVISQLLLLIILWHYDRPFSQRSNSPTALLSWRHYLKYGAPLVVSGLCLFLVCGAERWIIAGVLTTTDVALYAIASQFAMMVAVCIEPFTLWWFPKRLQMLQHKDGLDHVAKFASVGCILSFAAAILIGFLGPVLIIKILPSSYADATTLLPLLCLAMALKQCSHLLNTGCYSGNSTRTVGQINATLAAIAPILYVTACWLWQLNGLLYALVIIYSLRLCWFFYTSQRLLFLPYPMRHLLLCFASAAALLTVMPTLTFASTFVATMTMLFGFGVIVLRLCRSISNVKLREAIS